MSQFNEALKNFKTGTLFKLTNSVLTRKQIDILWNCMSNKTKSMDPENSSYSIHLENILLMPDASLKRDDAQQVICGALTTREFVKGLVGEHYTDMSIVYFHQYTQMSPLLKHLELDEYPQESKTELENCFIDLFREQSFWSSVTLKKIQLLTNGVLQYPSLDFFCRLSVALDLQVKCLKKLALSLITTPRARSNTKVNLARDERFAIQLDVSELIILFRRFLIQADRLESLYIKVGDPVSQLLQELRSILINLPNLKSLTLKVSHS